MIEWGQKWNPTRSRGLTTKPKQTPRPKKNPMLNFRAWTISLEIKCLCLFILHTIWILRLLWISKNSRFKSSHSKENLARLSYPKKPQNLKFHNHFRQSLWSLFFVKTLCLIFLANYLRWVFGNVLYLRPYLGTKDTSLICSLADIHRLN